MWRTISFLVVALTSLPLVFAQSAEPPSIVAFLTAEEREASGLAKLSQSELVHRK